MASLKEVKSRILSVTSTQQITKAMKMVAAARLRKAQDNIIQMRPYAQKLLEILHNVSAGNDGDVQNLYADSRNPDKVLLVVITSDKGLCGPFNSNVFKATLQLISEKYKEVQAAGNLTIMPIGKRSLDFFKKRKLQVVEDYAMLFTSMNFTSVREAAEYAMSHFVEGDFDRVHLVYNEFKNVATQILRTEQFLPVEAVETESQEVSATDYIYEPSKTEIVEDLIPKSLKIQFYKALLESNAAEHGARMTAMDKATENAGELLKELKLTYNRTRQAAITKEILEIVAGAEALSSS
ncbi:MAG: ATP synthase F1 subunit gamma [Cyclobacteriaceae bacterium]|nr:ATP synthase F1 subunit gamma [Cyclobacteriaceae bacterium]